MLVPGGTFMPQLFAEKISTVYMDAFKKRGTEVCRRYFSFASRRPSLARLIPTSPSDY